MPSTASKSIRRQVRHRTLSDPARPFLKWAGGKSQLLPQLEKFFPSELKARVVKRYFEPFLGGGAVFFYLAQRYPNLGGILADTNRDLIGCYLALRENAAEVIRQLKPLVSRYADQKSAKQKKVFYEIRREFNAARKELQCDSFQRAAQMIFLNKTCFNGLYRVNANGEFNTPSGAGPTTRPSILDIPNLQSAACLLRRFEIRHAAYQQIESCVRRGDFVYLDPPYRPLSKTSSFNAYTPGGFGDSDQHDLAKFYSRLDKKGAFVMLSNSDPRATDPNDSFFDDLYSQFHVRRVQANRMVNSDGQGRGKISEIVVTNY